MLFVDRSRVPVPEILRTERAEKERQRAREYFTRRLTSKAALEQSYQERFEWDFGLLEEVRPALVELFHNKCAFCEQAEKPAGGLYLTHFRPISETIDDSAKERVAGYWWLAYEWENLYLSCPTCNRRSTRQFPVLGPRAMPEAKGAQLRAEQALLLDPCNQRDAKAVAFDAARTRGPRGTLQSTGSVDLMERGDATIEVFGLNRPSLVSRRAEALGKVTGLLERALRSPSGKTVQPLAVALADDREFSGVLMQAVRKRIDELKPVTPAALIKILEEVDETPAVAKPLPESPPTTAAPIVSAVPPQPGAEVSAARNKRKGAKPPRRVRRYKSGFFQAGEWYLQRVEIRNFRAIERLDVEIPAGHSSAKGNRTGWKVLLGQNGAGKSTFLEAIVLAFMGQKYIRQARLRGRDLLRKTSGTKRAQSGHVTLHWVGGQPSTTIRFTDSRIWFEGPEPPPPMTLRAYGPTRNMSSKPGKPGADDVRRDVANLFDPFVAISDVRQWLGSFRSAEKRGSAFLSLKDILGLSPRTRIKPKGGTFTTRLNGVDVTLAEMSAGYQSTVALAADIMAAVHGDAHDLRYAMGIVIVDEIDAHLHPRWKMIVVERLRRTFPQMQFIVTTHEPLCLRGLKAGEIAVMKREGKKVRLITDVPSTEGMRVDQLLTSELFGLYSTLDPDLDHAFRDYYGLLGKDRLDAAETEELNRLREQVKGVGVLGNTRRDQLVYEIIDKHVAEERQQLRETRFEISPELRTQVLAAWNDATSVTQAAQ